MNKTDLSLVDYSPIIAIVVTIIGGIFWYFKHSMEYKFEAEKKHIEIDNVNSLNDLKLELNSIVSERDLLKIENQNKINEINSEYNVIKDKLRQAEQAILEYELRIDKLQDDIKISGSAGEAALFQKHALDDELRRIMTFIAASGGSLYVPSFNLNRVVHGLIFLCIEPFNRNNQKLKSKMIPLKSIAGKCFETKKSSLIKNAWNNESHFKSAENIAQYKPSTMINTPLKDSDNNVIGVLQLLRKEGERPFTYDDLKSVEDSTRKIVDLLMTLSKSPYYLKILGLDESKSGRDGSVLCFDLSNSGLLFQRFPVENVHQILDEYINSMIGAALKFGATRDNVMGDGALLRFNVPNPCEQHEYAAVKAALEMKNISNRLKNDWIEIAPELSSLSTRIGVSTGPLLQVSLGSSHMQRLTVIGYPIAVATSLCDFIPRDHSSIYICDDIYKSIKNDVNVKIIEGDLPLKAKKWINNAYEIID